MTTANPTRWSVGVQRAKVVLQEISRRKARGEGEEEEREEGGAGMTHGWLLVGSRMSAVQVGFVVVSGSGKRPS